MAAVMLKQCRSRVMLQAVCVISVSYTHLVAMAKLESGMFYKSYDVVFTNGEKVEFDKSGEWKEVRCRQSERCV